MAAHLNADRSTRTTPGEAPVPAPLTLFNVPIALTWLRIVLIPVFVGVYYLPPTVLSLTAKNWSAMTIFALAAITDWLDGYLARRWGEVSAFGAFLDPGLVWLTFFVRQLVLSGVLSQPFDQRLLRAFPFGS
jgi:phosphatidylglycerophosphate synthase